MLIIYRIKDFMCFQQNFSYIMTVSFIQGENWTTLIFHMLLTNFITYGCNESASTWEEIL